MDQHTAVSLVAKLAAVEVIVACAEYIADPRQLQDEGLMSWKVGRLRNAWLAANGALLDPVLRYPNVLAIVSFRLLLAAVIVFAPPALLSSAWIIAPAALSHRRVPFAKCLRTRRRGSDDMDYFLRFNDRQLSRNATGRNSVSLVFGTTSLPRLRDGGNCERRRRAIGATGVA